MIKGVPNELAMLLAKRLAIVGTEGMTEALMVPIIEGITIHRSHQIVHCIYFLDL